MKPLLLVHKTSYTGVTARVVIIIIIMSVFLERFSM